MPSDDVQSRVARRDAHEPCLRPAASLRASRGTA
jgi:hypothetical protein